MSMASLRLLDGELAVDGFFEADDDADGSGVLGEGVGGALLGAEDVGAGRELDGGGAGELGDADLGGLEEAGAGPFVEDLPAVVGGWRRGR